MHGLLQHSTSEAKILKVQIGRKIILVKAVRNKLGRKHLRHFRVRMLYGIDIGLVACNYPDLAIGAVIFCLDRNNTSHDIDHLDKTLEIHAMPPHIKIS
jgi:hypothetical protein